MMNVNCAFKMGVFALRRNASPLLAELVTRNLYSPAALGVDNYSKTRERIKNQFVNVQDKFKSKMADYSNPESNSMIFTEDLKHMIHLVEPNDNDLQVVQNMMIKFSKQNKDLRFGSFVFGPVVMRMYHFLNRPEEAYQIFFNREMDGFFDQLKSFHIILDLLYKNKMYPEMFEIFEVIKRKQVQGTKYPKTAVILMLAACYKMNKRESLKYAKHLWSELNKIGHIPIRRAGTFTAALALNQNEPDVALEVLSSLKQQNYVTVRNLKLSAFADLNRFEDILYILRSTLQIDSANTEKKNTFSEEIINKIKEAIEKSGKNEFKEEFEKIEHKLRSLDQISEEPLDKLLCSEINALIPSAPQKYQTIDRDNYARRRQKFRPGLDDLY
ncbi:hypothetical protein O3M35_004002 [Rhynocoris fuscipes]|uniref:Pentatricopeptide repeat-containing protein 2 n=1 Tax=Rhynocoris fuscipes TaxID=488301 RepID=A0AAW1CMS7_9HEMI